MVNLAREESAMNFKYIQCGAATGDKVFSAQSRDVRTGSRITSRRVTQSNWKISPTGREIAFMYTLNGTTARSWRGPSVVSFAINQDGHTVFGLDLFNQVPTRSDLFSGIDDLDSFVKNHNIGFEKTQVRSESADSTYEASDKHFSGSSVKDCLDVKAREKGDQNPTHHESTRGTKLHGVVHAPSLPQLKINVDPKQEGHINE